mmetsp:Transcript_38582/g.81143  ORF Transcript_38582/g.81143 Transcript_38582/m.81143 type:complete len:88 (-) Transcript_38582:1325-1588(-)
MFEPDRDELLLPAVEWDPPVRMFEPDLIFDPAGRRVEAERGLAVDLLVEFLVVEGIHFLPGSFVYVLVYPNAVFAAEAAFLSSCLLR